MLTFAAAVFFLIITPGPGVLSTAGVGAAFGARAGTRYVLGLFIAGPLAAHSRRARFELWLIAVSSLWIIGNLLRLLSVELFGAPGPDSAYDTVFQVLTFLGLAGWVGFPYLLLRRVVAETQDGRVAA